MQSLGVVFLNYKTRGAFDRFRQRLCAHWLGGQFEITFRFVFFESHPFVAHSTSIESKSHRSHAQCEGLRLSDDVVSALTRLPVEDRVGILHRGATNIKVLFHRVIAHGILRCFRRRPRWIPKHSRTAARHDLPAADLNRWLHW